MSLTFLKLDRAMFAHFWQHCISGSTFHNFFPSLHKRLIDTTTTIMLSITRFSFYKIVIYEMSARRHFSHMSALFEARATKERVLHLRECAEYVFSHRSSYNLFETNIMSDLLYTFYG
jgi:hypothetical protein